jgi:hypothetical protein
MSSDSALGELSRFAGQLAIMPVCHGRLDAPHSTHSRAQLEERETHSSRGPGPLSPPDGGEREGAEHHGDERRQRVVLSSPEASTRMCAV